MLFVGRPEAFGLILGKHREQTISPEKIKPYRPTKFPVASISNALALPFRFAVSETQVRCIQHLPNLAVQPPYNQQLQNQRLKSPWNQHFWKTAPCGPLHAGPIRGDGIIR